MDCCRWSGCGRERKMGREGKERMNRKGGKEEWGGSEGKGC